MSYQNNDGCGHACPGTFSHEAPNYNFVFRQVGDWLSRSTMFIKPDKFTVDNILVSRTDSVVLDLEDAVPLNKKDQARQLVGQKLKDPVITNVVSIHILCQAANYIVGSSNG